MFKSVIELLNHLADNHHIEEQFKQESSNEEMSIEEPDWNITCGKFGEKNVK